MALKDIPGTTSVFAERTTGGYFLDFDLKRDQLARYGLTVDDANDVLMSAVGGSRSPPRSKGGNGTQSMSATCVTTAATSTRCRECWSNTPSGAQIPLGQVADISLKTGPGMIRDENGRVSGYVYVDVSGRDIGSYVTDAKKVVADKVSVPAGYQLVWSGQYESMERVKERLKIVVPITLFIVFLLLYLNTKSTVKTFIILLAVPFSAIGAIWFLYLFELQHEYCGVGRTHRAAWSGCRDRCLHVVVPRSCVSRSGHQSEGGRMNMWDDLLEAIVARGCQMSPALR